MNLVTSMVKTMLERDDCQLASLRRLQCSWVLLGITETTNASVHLAMLMTRRLNDADSWTAK